MVEVVVVEVVVVVVEPTSVVDVWLVVSVASSVKVSVAASTDISTSFLEESESPPQDPKRAQIIKIENRLFLYLLTKMFFLYFCDITVITKTKGNISCSNI